MDAWLACKISAGQFSDEFAVKIDTAEPGGASLFASKEDLEFEGPLPTGSTSVSGRIRIEIIQQSDNLALVRLPHATLENGQHITVREDLLHQEA